ncbi:PAS domain-containing protein [Methylobacterium organophilum]|uniref:sensor histidine kinase n=1 Tax=Methylobacterium organophilum TaxID=410 RepID=UPI001F141FCB|nr:PAS domain-containing protein [Methylobacterium organophilum]UMY15529.1 PAS domain-containing protein [Methylobacterium organophilum]
MTTEPKPDGHAFDRDFWRAEAHIDAILPGVGSQIADSELRLLADNIPTLCWMARGDGCIVWYNRRWHEYCGTTPEAMEGWGWQAVHDPAELDRVMKAWTTSIATGEPVEMVCPLRGADGIFRPFLTRIVPLRDGTGRVIRWFGVNMEIGAQRRAEAARDATQAQYDVLTDAMPQMVWSTLPDGYHDYYNDRWYEFTGVPVGSTDGEAWNGMFHPEDQERAWKRWRHSLATGEPYEVEYRLRHRSGEYRWTLGRALPVRDEEGRIIRWIGTCTDIDAAKRVAEQNELLNRELSHRIKNIFAIISGLIRLSARRDPAVKDFARDLMNRIAALGRAHEFARPHSEESRPEMPEMMLQGMLRDLFEPYGIDGVPRVAVEGDDVPVDDKGATPLALLFHELATNAAKYGALSVPDGRVRVSVARTGDDLTLVWEEQGGPAIEGPPSRRGFGTQLATMSVEQQLGGLLVREWRREGLRASVALRCSRLVRS